MMAFLVGLGFCFMMALPFALFIGAFFSNPWVGVGVFVFMFGLSADVLFRGSDRRK